MQIPLAEHIKCEGTLWPLQGGREETCPKQLRNSIGVARAAALMDRDAVNAVGMGDCIVDRHGKGVKKGTPGAVVTQVKHVTDIAEVPSFEKVTVPLIRPVEREAVVSCYEAPRTLEWRL